MPIGSTSKIILGKGKVGEFLKQRWERTGGHGLHKVTRVMVTKRPLGHTAARARSSLAEQFPSS